MSAATASTRDSARAATRVFLADDSAAIRERVGDLLRRATCEVVGQAATPDACIAGILAARPDVVVLDCQLQGGSGLQVLRAVRRDAPATAFVVFSNNAGAPYRKRYLDEGALCFLDKSSDIDRLAAAVAGAHAFH